MLDDSCVHKERSLLRFSCSGQMPSASKCFTMWLCSKDGVCDRMCTTGRREVVAGLSLSGCSQQSWSAPHDQQSSNSKKQEFCACALCWPWAGPEAKKYLEIPEKKSLLLVIKKEYERLVMSCMPRLSVRCHPRHHRFLQNKFKYFRREIGARERDHDVARTPVAHLQRAVNNGHFVLRQR